MGVVLLQIPSAVPADAVLVFIYWQSLTIIITKIGLDGSIHAVGHLNMIVDKLVKIGAQVNLCRPL